MTESSPDGQDERTHEVPQQAGPPRDDAPRPVPETVESPTFPSETDTETATGGSELSPVLGNSAPAAPYDPSIDRGASWNKVVEAGFYLSAKWNPDDPDGRSWYEQAYGPRLEAFEAESGVIKKEFWCSNFLAACCLTEKDQVHAINNETPDDADPLLQLVSNADSVYTESREFLRGDGLKQERRTVAELFFGILTNILGHLDNTHKLPPDERRAARATDNARVVSMAGDVKYLRRYYQQSAQRTAQLHYFKGMVITAAILYSAALVFTILLFSVMDAVRPSFGPFLATFVAGASGAVVSVLSRMTFGNIDLDHTVGWSQLRNLGAFRPIIGAIFGVAIFLALEGGVLDALQPDDPSRAGYFYASLAFLGGFSERWAQDMLSRGPTGQKTPTDEE